MEEKTIYYISEAAKKVQVESHVLRYWEDELELPIMRNEMGHRYYTEQDIKKLQEIKQLKEQGLQLKAIRTVLFRVPGTIGEKAEDILMQQLSQTVTGSSEAGEQETKVPPGQPTLQEKQIPSGQSTSQEKQIPPGQPALQEEQTPPGRPPQPGDTPAEMAQQQEQRMKPETENGTDAKKAAGHEEAGRADMEEYQIKEAAEQIDIDKPQRFIVALSKDKEEPAAQEAQYDDTDKSRKAARLQYLLQHMITEAVKAANKELCTDVKESILKELDYQFRMQEERDEERWKKEEEHYRRIDEMIRERHRPKERLGRGKKKSPVKDDPISL